MGTKFNNANMTHASLMDGNFLETVFVGTDLSSAYFDTDTELPGGVSTTGMVNMNGSLEGLDLTRAHLWGESLYNRSMENANLAGMDVRGTTFNGSNMHGAQLQGTMFGVRSGGEREGSRAYVGQVDFSMGILMPCFWAASIAILYPASA